MALRTQPKEGLRHPRRHVKYARLISRGQKVNPDGSPEVPYYQFPALCRDDHQLAHGIFTRKGGVSRPPYDSLNTSLTTGDRPEHVRRNLQIIKAVIEGGHLVSVNQVHGSEILSLRLDDPVPLGRMVNADAMITNVGGLALMVKQADCQAVMLFDPSKRVIANVHCGWRGSVLNILAATVASMRAEFGSRAADLRAVIGPSLGPCCAEFRSYREMLPDEFRAFMVSEGYFDFWGISRWQLIRAGLTEGRIWIAGLCSRCHAERFVSYRASKVTGRSASVIMLKSIPGSRSFR